MAHPLPADSVRGRVRLFIAQHANLLGADVIECGAKIHDPIAWWMSARDLATGRWTGVDQEPGDNVDVVADLERLPADWAGAFTGAVCSEVLEHVRRPSRALFEIRRVLKPGGVLIVTTLTAFPLHGFPADYRRWTERGLAVELEDSGFVDIRTERAGAVEFRLNDHGEAGVMTLSSPIHAFAVCRVPC